MEGIVPKFAEEQSLSGWRIWISNMLVVVNMIRSDSECFKGMAKDMPTDKDVAENHRNRY